MSDWVEWAKENCNVLNAKDKPEALDDVLVLDLSYGNFAGLFTSSLLAEFGAEVIKIEPPEGDVARKMTPYGLKIKDTGLAYIVEGRNKFHITLNLESEEGREIFRELAEKADVVIETFKPGYMDSLGIGYRQLSKINPGLVYTAIYSFGHFGTKAGNGIPDYDVINQAMGGITWTTGIPEEYEEYPEHTRVPTRMGPWMGWYVGGGFAVFGIMVALFWRTISGRGQFIDVSEAEAMAKVQNYYVQYWHTFRDTINRVANFDPAVYPYTLIKVKDGMAFIAGFSDPNWKALCTILGRDDLIDKYPTIKERLTPENWPKALKGLEKVTANMMTEELIQATLEYKGEGTAVAGELLTPKESFEVENWWMRGALMKVKDPYYGELAVQGIAPKHEKTPGRIKWLCKPAGEDNEFIFKKYLGYGKSKLEELKNKGVI